MTLNMLLSVYSVDSRAATWVRTDVTREKRAHFKNEKIGILKACIGQQGAFNERGLNEKANFKN